MTQHTEAHLVVQCDDDTVRVVPRSLIEDWIAGRQQIQNTEDWEPIFRRIVEEWLEGLMLPGLVLIDEAMP